jgi:hypothetical protein
MGKQHHASYQTRFVILQRHGGSTPPTNRPTNMNKSTALKYVEQILPIYPSHQVCILKLLFATGYEINILEGNGYETRIKTEESAQEYIRIHE